MAGKLARGKKGESLVSEILSKSKSYHRNVDNFFLVGPSGMTHQIDHIDIRENGIFIIETKNIYGDIKGSILESKWSHKVYQNGKPVVKQFFNPMMQNDAHRKILMKYLGDKVIYVPIIVFVNNNIEHLGIPDVINMSSLLNCIETYDTGVKYDKAKIDRLFNKLMLYKSGASEEEHLHNIRNQQKENTINKKILIQCLKEGICPKCGIKLKSLGNNLTCSSRKCGYKINIEEMLKLTK